MLRPVRKDDNERPVERPVNQDLEAEVLGMPLALAFYSEPEKAQKALHDILTVEPDVFVKYEHRVLLQAYQRLAEKNLSPTIPHLHQVILEMGEWSSDEAKGGIGTGFLLDLQESGGLLSELPAILYDLRKLKHRRDVQYAIDRLSNHASQWNEGTTPDIASALEKLNRIFSSPPDGRESPNDIPSLLNQDFAVLEAQASGEIPDMRIWSGFSELDKFTGGLIPGNLVVVAARTSMGKTSFAGDIALHSVMFDNPTAYFSLEMTSQEILRRLIAKVARINILRLRHGDLYDWQLIQYRQAADEMRELPLFIFDQNVTPSDMEREIHTLNRKLHPNRIKLAVVDHLQLMGARDQTRYERRDRQLAAYTAALKDIAKTNECCVILLSQLNRNVEYRPLDERLPRLSDLRESGAIEQDADIVVGLYRPYVDDPGADPTHADLVILKNRNGPTGRLSLRWTGETASFHDVGEGNV